MDQRKRSLYDAQESEIMQQSAAFVEFLTRKGMIEDQAINNAKVRKAKQSTAKRAYHNTEAVLDKYRTIVWVLECVPDEMAKELLVPTKNLDELATRLDIEMTRENRNIENRMNAALKTRVLLDRVQDALCVLRKKPDTGERLYEVIYGTYIDPQPKKHEDLLEELQMSARTYYRLRKEAISIMSIRLWSAPSSEIADWLEVLTLLENG